MKGTIEIFALNNPEDVERFNELFGKKGFMIGEDLLGTPMVYVDNTLVNPKKKKKNVRNAGRHKTYDRIFEKKVIEMCESGVGPTAVAEQMGCSKGYVSKLIRKHQQQKKRVRKR